LLIRALLLLRLRPARALPPVRAPAPVRGLRLYGRVRLCLVHSVPSLRS